MKPFDYFAPTTISEATRILADYGEEARALAGGTDLLVRLKRKQVTLRAVVNLKRLPGLREIALNGELRLGALVTLNEILYSPLIRRRLPVLAATAGKMASVQVRSLATVGGNLCNASPAGDMAPPLIALNARAVIVGPGGERVVPLEDFFLGAGQSVLRPGEILREILVPRPDESTRVTYQKFEHRAAMDIAIVGVAIAAKIQNQKSKSHIRPVSFDHDWS